MKIEVGKMQVMLKGFIPKLKRKKKKKKKQTKKLKGEEESIKDLHPGWAVSYVQLSSLSTLGLHSQGTYCLLC